MIDTIFEKILSQTHTLQQINRKVRFLREFINQKLYGSKEAITAAQSEDAIYLDWIKSLEPTLLNQINQSNVSEVFNTLEKKIAELKVLIIYVAFDMPEKDLSPLGEYLKSNFGAEFVFDVRFDPNLIGGASLVWNGVYHDFSLKKSIEDNKQAILTEIQSFLKH